MDGLEDIDRKILDYLEREWIERAHRPTYEEIRQALDISSKDFVSRHVHTLEDLGHVQCNSTSRSIVIMRNFDGYRITAGGYSLPVLGYISAGAPIPLPDSNAQPIDWVDVTYAMVSGNPKGAFALRVRGDSMIEDRVYDGNTVVVRRQDTAEDGDTIAARLLNDRTSPQTTLKKFYRVDDKIQLQPRNCSLKAKLYDPEDVEILGKLLSVLNIE
jgi:repressor LexA